MKKIYLILIILILLVNSVAAIDVVYVFKDNRYFEQNIVNSIDELGYNYSLVEEDDVDSTNFNNYDLIVVGDGYIPNVPVNDHKSIILNSRYYRGWSKTIGAVTSTHPLNANKREHHTFP